MRKSGVIAGLAALTACTAAAPPEASLPGPAFDPVAFFTGATHGDGKLDQIMKRQRIVTVDSVGTPTANGALTLTQRIATQGDKPRTREWTLKQVAPGRYSGELTDANGPVETIAIGRAIRIRYPMKSGLKVEQWLVALPGGRVLDNRLTVTKWGMKVASLHERITKVD